MRNIVILGSTGSIGTQALEVVRNNSDRYRIIGLVCGENARLLNEQVREFEPDFHAVGPRPDEIRLLITRPDVDIVVNAISGMAGVVDFKKIFEARVDEGTRFSKTPQKQKNVQNFPEGKFDEKGERCHNMEIRPGVRLNSEISTEVDDEAEPRHKLRFRPGTRLNLPVAENGGAINHQPATKKIYAIANKESLVTIEPHKNIIPIDSELTAIHYLLQKFPCTDVEAVYLTCSGGPFYDKPLAKLEKVTPEEALKHPVWNMGDRNSLDSATLLNKAFEVIAAANLFNLPPEKIRTVIDPKVQYHAFIKLKNGEYHGVPALKHSMTTMIEYALAYPDHELPIRQFDFEKAGFIDSSKTELPGIQIGYEVLHRGLGKRLCEANEAAVTQFLEGGIKFTDIYEHIYNQLGFRV